jgi:hypothetical protein
MSCDLRMLHVSIKDISLSNSSKLSQPYQCSEHSEQIGASYYHYLMSSVQLEQVL